ncbi:PBP1A family penicillin-binding protein [Gracilibacillus salitolerans]|uniref:PBP1A family penicillin-binding protein n=1 Tax=Gracilibacillus salitolerans TaxID=2663022 RepID=A0A5Q2TIN7_9BACI|nr:penicillin-binding protein 1A [Gracilibacillus salitolerans]QGH34759.1 PBP1A family penicillin-binding protein [Gracilibacillus salitolerans]
MADKSQSRMERRKQLKQKNTKNKPIWKKIMKYALIAVLVIGLGIGALFTYYIASAPDLDAELLSDPASTNLYDINGDTFAKLGAEKRTKIEYDDMPSVLLNAILATEDVRFHDHIGIDFRRIGGAVIANFREGFGAQGASTITQQVVKGSFLTNDKKLKRKVQEQWLALQLDRVYSKEEIMEMYVNKIYYGSGAYGVAMAAEIYFGKTDLDDLTLAEAAILAGLPQRPTAYDPFVNPDLTKERMNTVLNYMVQHNKISEEEADEAREVNIEDLLTVKKPEFVKYEGFIQQVRKEVQEKTGADIYKDSLDVYTTLDPDAQEHVEFLLSDADDNPIDYSADEEMQVGLTVLDTKTGAIRAIGPGRNRENDGWNYAIDGNGRQGGSTMKPIISYGPAIEELNWSTYHQINDDEPYPIEGTDAVVRNWNRNYQGWMSIRYALEQSLNVPAVKTLDEVGYNNAKEFAEGIGMDFEDNFTLTDAIGGAGSTVTPIEMAGAYATFGNEGMYHEPFSVIRIDYSDRRSEELESKSTVAMSDYTAYMITDMLKSVVREGTGTRANVSGLQLAGKTGTTNLTDDEGGGSPDSWFAGYTTNYTVSVWTGYDKERKALNNTKIAQDLFRETMSFISQDMETEDFVKPDSVVEVQVEKGSNPAKRPSEYTPDSEIVTELFVKGTEPDAISEKFDELDPVTNLSASYDEESESITAEWDHKGDDVEFKVSAGTDGSLNDLTTTENKEVEISNVDKGKTYTIEVIAVNDDMESDPKTVTVEVPEDEAEDLPQVSQLNQTFDPANRSALISWEYDQNGPIEFEIVVQDGGQTIDQFNTNKNSVNITQLEANKTYTVHVTPFLKNKDVRGPSASIQVPTQGIENEEQEPDDNEQDNEEQEEQPNEDEQQSDEDQQNQGDQQPGQGQNNQQEEPNGEED